MSGWSFEDALVAIQSPASIPFLVLLSMDGICLGDVCFAKVQTTLCMWSVSIPTLERWIEGRKFNPNRKARDEYSHSTSILVILNPNNQDTGLKCMSIRLIIRWCNGNVGQIKDILKLITHARSQLQESKSPQTFCIIVGDYGGSMGFATDLPFCMLIRCHLPIRMIRCRWLFGIHRTSLPHSEQTFYWFANYSHKIVLCTSM